MNLKKSAIFKKAWKLAKIMSFVLKNKKQYNFRVALKMVYVIESKSAMFLSLSKNSLKNIIPEIENIKQLLNVKFATEDRIFYLSRLFILEREAFIYNHLIMNLSK